MINRPVRQSSPGPAWEILQDASSEGEQEEETDQLGLPGTGGSRKRKEQRAESGNNAKRARFGLAAGEGHSPGSNEYNPSSSIQVTPRQHPSPGVTRTGRGIVHSSHAAKGSSLSNGQVQRDKTIDTVAYPVTGQGQSTSITAHNTAVDPSRQSTDAAAYPAIGQEQSISVPNRVVPKTARKTAVDPSRLTFIDVAYSTTSQGQSISAPRVARKRIARKRATEPFRRVEFLSAPPGATRPLARTREEKTRQDSPIDDSSDSESLPFSPSFQTAPVPNKQLSSSAKPPSTKPSQPSTGSGPKLPSLSRLSTTQAEVIDISSDGEVKPAPKAEMGRRPVDPHDVLVISSDDDSGTKRHLHAEVSRRPPSTAQATATAVIEILDSDDDTFSGATIPRSPPGALESDIIHRNQSPLIAAGSLGTEGCASPPTLAFGGSEDVFSGPSALEFASDASSKQSPSHITLENGARLFSSPIRTAGFRAGTSLSASHNDNVLSPRKSGPILPLAGNQTTSPQRSPHRHPNSSIRPLPLSLSPKRRTSTNSSEGNGQGSGQTSSETSARSGISSPKHPISPIQRRQKLLGRKRSSSGINSTSSPTSAGNAENEHSHGRSSSEIDIHSLKITHEDPSTTGDKSISPGRKLSLPVIPSSSRVGLPSPRRRLSLGMNLADAITQASQDNTKKVPPCRSQTDEVPEVAEQNEAGQRLQEEFEKPRLLKRMVQGAVSARPVSDVSVSVGQIFPDQAGSGVIRRQSPCDADQCSAKRQRTDSPVAGLSASGTSGQSCSDFEMITSPDHVEQLINASVGTSVAIPGNTEFSNRVSAAAASLSTESSSENIQTENDDELEYIDGSEEHTGMVQATGGITVNGQLGVISDDEASDGVRLDDFEILQKVGGNERRGRVTRSSSPDPMDILDGLPNGNVTTPPTSSDSSSSRAPTPHWATHSQITRTFEFEGFTILNWNNFRLDLSNFTPRFYLSKNLPHSLQDHINHMSEWTRSLPDMRTVLMASIQENTAIDEPDAPPISVENFVDQEPTPPWEFHYSNHMWHGEGVPPPDIDSLVSCDCIGRCDPRSKTCACVRRQREAFEEENADFAYDTKGRMKELGYPIFECNDLCGCDEDCRNRVVQHGRTCAIAIRKTENKGWGVFANQKKIHKGTFIGIYAGEILTDEEGEQRGMKYDKLGRTYLFDIDFHHLRKGHADWQSKYTVDAYHAGNFTRFLNHSCDPNCKLNPCYINEGNIDKPLLTVFAKRDIEAGEELCFSYSGDPDDDEDDNENTLDDTGSDKNDAVYAKCYCGAKNCKGRLFGG